LQAKSRKWLALDGVESADANEIGPHSTQRRRVDAAVEGLAELEVMLRVWAQRQAADSVRITDAAVRRPYLSPRSRIDLFRQIRQEALHISRDLHLEPATAAQLSTPSWVGSFRSRCGIRDGRLRTVDGAISPATAPLQGSSAPLGSWPPTPHTAPPCARRHYGGYPDATNETPVAAVEQPSPLARSFSLPSFTTTREVARSDARPVFTMPDGVCPPHLERSAVYSSLATPYPTPELDRSRFSHVYGLPLPVPHPVMPFRTLTSDDPFLSAAGPPPPQHPATPPAVQYDYYAPNGYVGASNPAAPHLLRRATISAWPVSGSQADVEGHVDRPAPSISLDEAVGALDTLQNFVSAHAGFATPSEVAGLGDLLGRAAAAREMEADDGGMLGIGENGYRRCASEEQTIGPSGAKAR
jgi:hypothetical protein